MNQQVYPGYLKANLKICGLDLVSLCISMFTGVILKRIWDFESNTSLVIIFVLYLIIEIASKFIPKENFYHFLSKKRVINEK